MSCDDCVNNCPKSDSVPASATSGLWTRTDDDPPWGTCPLCFSRKKPKVLRQLGHGELHQCPDCGETYTHSGESYVGRDW
jgi:hypothetical protein